MNSPTLRWGILGPANIARKIWQAIRLSGNGTLVAVASREVTRARSFIVECQSTVPFDLMPRALGSYEDLIADPGVDALYIPLPTGLRKEWVIRAAQAGKHIICEKPCAINAADLREMLEACQRNGVEFLDNVMFRHNLRLARMRAALDDGESVGQLHRVESAFSFRAPENFVTDNIRAQSALEPLGCLGDLGWYCIQLSLWAAGWRLPTRVSGRTLVEHHSPAAVPMEFTGELFFSGGLSASFFSSFLASGQQWAHLSGEQGRLVVDDFVLPFGGEETAFELRQNMFKATGCDFRMSLDSRRITVAEHGNGHPSAQETNLFRAFTAQVLSGKRHQSWPEIAMKTQLVMDACRESAAQDGRAVALSSALEWKP